MIWEKFLISLYQNRRIFLYLETILLSFILYFPENAPTGPRLTEGTRGQIHGSAPAAPTGPCVGDPAATQAPGETGGFKAVDGRQRDSDYTAQLLAYFLSVDYGGERRKQVKTSGSLTAAPWTECWE